MEKTEAAMIRGLAIFASVIALTLTISEPAFAGCPQGKITCAEWCAKYKYGSPGCMSGYPNSCDHKPQGADSCVRDSR
jgi:hypothetical protein